MILVHRIFLPVLEVKNKRIANHTANLNFRRSYLCLHHSISWPIYEGNGNSNRPPANYIIRRVSYPNVHKALLNRGHKQKNVHSKKLWTFFCDTKVKSTLCE